MTDHYINMQFTVDLSEGTTLAVSVVREARKAFVRIANPCRLIDGQITTLFLLVFLLVFQFSSNLSTCQHVFKVHMSIKPRMYTRPDRFN